MPPLNMYEVIGILNNHTISFVIKEWKIVSTENDYYILSSEHNIDMKKVSFNAFGVPEINLHLGGDRIISFSAFCFADQLSFVEQRITQNIMNLTSFLEFRGKTRESKPKKVKRQKESE